MPSIFAFAAGFATGWIVRSSVDSTRGIALRTVSGVLSTVERAKRVVAMEKEYFEDFVAEGRALFEASKARARGQKKVTLVPDERSVS